MLCPKCGKENPEDAARCVACGAEMSASTAGSKTSGMAIASLALGVLGLLGITALAGLILGIVAISRINASGGRVKGKGLAIAGICVSSCMLLLSAMALPAAILFPVFARARESARKAGCQSNLVQVSKALKMYATDYDDIFPIAANWCDALQPHTEKLAAQEPSLDVWKCPSALNQRCGYAYNSRLSSVPVSSIQAFAEKATLFDAKGEWNTSGGAELAEARHLGSLNVAYVDGHVKGVPSLDPSWLDLDAEAPGPVASE